LDSSRVKITFQTKAGNHTVDCAEGENVLFAGLRGGVAVAYECATGTCGTCRCRVMDGPVDLQWNDAPGLTYVKREKNEILMCQAVPTGDCVVRVPGDIAKFQDGPTSQFGRMENFERLTHDVVIFSVALERPMSFMAGQFAVLTSPGIEGGRAYSMTNHAASVDRLEFVVKRKHGGGFCNWLFDGSPEGAALQVFGPLGRAIFDPAEGKNVLCIAGGSGIAGMMAILEHGTASGYFGTHRADVFFGVRTGADVFFGEALNRYVEASPKQVSVTIALSDEAPDAELARRFPSLNFAQGFVHEVAAVRMKDRYENICGYVAGPPPMVDGTLRTLVLEARLPGTDIRYDKFG
jgi:toluene monooxygenase electron transfer component